MPFIYDVLMTGQEPPIHQALLGIDLIPANRELSALDANLGETKNRQFLLQKMLKKIEPNYDFILLDCPPNLRAKKSGGDSGFVICKQLLIQELIEPKLLKPIWR